MIAWLLGLCALQVAPTVLSFLEQIFPMVAKRLLDARRAGSAAGGSTGKPAIRPEVIEVVSCCDARAPAVDANPTLASRTPYAKAVHT